MSKNTRIWSTIGKGIKVIGKAAIIIVPIVMNFVNNKNKK